MTTTYTWLDDPEPLEWATGLRYSYGEVVGFRDLEVLEGRTGIIVGYDELGEGGVRRYIVEVEGEPVSWVLEEPHIATTGVVEPQRAPRRARPVLGNGTVVKLANTAWTRETGIANKIALTEGLWWGDESDEPMGYSVRLPGELELHSVSFEELNPVPGERSD